MPSYQEIPSTCFENATDTRVRSYAIPVQSSATYWTGASGPRQTYGTASKSQSATGDLDFCIDMSCANFPGPLNAVQSGIYLVPMPSLATVQGRRLPAAQQNFGTCGYDSSTSVPPTGPQLYSSLGMNKNLRVPELTQVSIASHVIHHRGLDPRMHALPDTSTTQSVRQVHTNTSPRYDAGVPPSQSRLRMPVAVHALPSESLHVQRSSFWEATIPNFSGGAMNGHFNADGLKRRAGDSSEAYNRNGVNVGVTGANSNSQPVYTQLDEQTEAIPRAGVVSGVDLGVAPLDGNRIACGHAIRSYVSASDDGRPGACLPAPKPAVTCVTRATQAQNPLQQAAAPAAETASRTMNTNNRVFSAPVAHLTLSSSVVVNSLVKGPCPDPKAVPIEEVQCSSAPPLAPLPASARVVPCDDTKSAQRAALGHVITVVRRPPVEGSSVPQRKVAAFSGFMLSTPATVASYDTPQRQDKLNQTLVQSQHPHGLLHHPLTMPPPQHHAAGPRQGVQASSPSVPGQVFVATAPLPQSAMPRLEALETQGHGHLHSVPAIQSQESVPVLLYAQLCQLNQQQQQQLKSHSYSVLTNQPQVQVAYEQQQQKWISAVPSAHQREALQLLQFQTQGHGSARQLAWPRTAPRSQPKQSQMNRRQKLASPRRQKPDLQQTAPSHWTQQQEMLQMQQQQEKQQQQKQGGLFHIQDLDYRHLHQQCPQQTQQRGDDVVTPALVLATACSAASASASDSCCFPGVARSPPLPSAPLLSAFHLGNQEPPNHGPEGCRVQRQRQTGQRQPKGASGQAGKNVSRSSQGSAQGLGSNTTIARGGGGKTRKKKNRNGDLSKEPSSSVDAHNDAEAEASLTLLDARVVTASACAAGAPPLCSSASASESESSLVLSTPPTASPHRFRSTSCHASLASFPHVNVERQGANIIADEAGSFADFRSFSSVGHGEAYVPPPASLVVDASCSWFSVSGGGSDNSSDNSSRSGSVKRHEAYTSCPSVTVTELPGGSMEDFTRGGGKGVGTCCFLPADDSSTGSASQFPSFWESSRRSPVASSVSLPAQTPARIADHSVPTSVACTETAKSELVPDGRANMAPIWDARRDQVQVCNDKTHEGSLPSKSEGNNHGHDVAAALAPSILRHVPAVESWLSVSSTTGRGSPQTTPSAAQPWHPTAFPPTGAAAGTGVNSNNTRADVATAHSTLASRVSSSLSSVGNSSSDFSSNSSTRLASWSQGEDSSSAWTSFTARSAEWTAASYSPPVVDSASACLSEWTDRSSGQFASFGTEADERRVNTAYQQCLLEILRQFQREQRPPSSGGALASSEPLSGGAATPISKPEEGCLGHLRRQPAPVPHVNPAPLLRAGPSSSSPLTSAQAGAPSLFSVPPFSTSKTSTDAEPTNALISGTAGYASADMPLGVAAGCGQLPNSRKNHHINHKLQETGKDGFSPMVSAPQIWSPSVSHSDASFSRFISSLLTNSNGNSMNASSSGGGGEDRSFSYSSLFGTGSSSVWGAAGLTRSLCPSQSASTPMLLPPPAFSVMKI